MEGSTTFNTPRSTIYFMVDKFEQLDIFTGGKSREYPKNPREIKRKREKRIKDLWAKTHIEEAKRRIENAGKKS